MKIPAAIAALRGVLLSLLLLVPVTPGAHAQPSTPAVEVVWSATKADFGGKMMDIDRFENVYSVGDTIVNGGKVLTRKFSPNGSLLWERIFQPAEQVKANWVAADPNGGAYVVGYKWTTSEQIPVGYFVLRYDADGNLVWSDVSNGSAAQAVRAVGDRAGNAYVTGGLYVAGTFTIGIVKYSPAGRQWVCPVVNPNGTGFPGTPLPTGLYLSDNGSWIAASGTSGYHFYVLSCDESGFKRWQDFRDPSVYAAAVAVNNAGEVYFGNGLAGGGGMQLSKYSATGIVQWTNVFSPGDYIHRLALDSLGNVIATGPDYGAYYANWVTMKVAPDGVRLWSRTFDGLEGNHEIPAFIAVDRFDSVFVTGVGGPAVTLANGSSYMRMVTLKYTATGEPAWTINSVDGALGNVVRVGQDGASLYVQGYGQMYTARYRQTGLADVPAAPAPTPTAPAPAPAPAAAPAAPANLGATAMSSSRIRLQWTNKSSAQTLIAIERCAVPCSRFSEIARIEGSATTFTNSGLASRNSYSYRVRAYKGTASSPYSASVTARTR
jgi:hypothetical protein